MACGRDAAELELEVDVGTVRKQNYADMDDEEPRIMADL